MKETTLHYVFVTSMTELCRWLRKDNVEIVDIQPRKGVCDEDIVKIYFKRKQEES